MIFRQLFDPTTSTYTYLLADPETKEALLIDPVKEQIERDIELLKDLGLELRYVLETHVHADHVTAAGELRRRLGAKTVLSAKGGVGCADITVSHGDVLRLGKLAIEVRATPGHTNSCTTYVLADRSMAFTGDALLIRGCGRTDFQQGDARTLYRSVHDQIFSLPGGTLLYPGHDYKGRTATTVAEERILNPRLGGDKTEAAFVEIMANLKLAPPKQIAIAVPANLRCGMAETAAQDGTAHRLPWAPITRSGTGVPEVPVDSVKDQRAESGARLIDVRAPSELVSELGAISGVENVPLQEIPQAAQGWDRKKPLILVCRSGGRSGQAALELERLGFTQVVSMAGGMLAWNQRRFPITHPSPAARA